MSNMVTFTIVLTLVSATIPVTLLAVLLYGTWKDMKEEKMASAKKEEPSLPKEEPVFVEEIEEIVLPKSFTSLREDINELLIQKNWMSEEELHLFCHTYPNDLANFEKQHESISRSDLDEAKKLRERVEAKIRDSLSVTKANIRNRQLKELEKETLVIEERG